MTSFTGTGSEISSPAVASLAVGAQCSVDTVEWTGTPARPIGGSLRGCFAAYEATAGEPVDDEDDLAPQLTIRLPATTMPTPKAVPRCASIGFTWQRRSEWSRATPALASLDGAARGS